MRILIVDDEKIIQKFLAGVLSRYGTCDQAWNGQEAVELYELSLAAGTPYNLIIMDIMMPVMSGLDATRIITTMRDTSEVPGAENTHVVMLSCLDDPKHLTEAQFDAGADAYLTKPLEIERLEEALVGLGLIEGGFEDA
ncbi:MAG: response regulator [Proteobacteria bacterium]|nr:response regulator [Pseudomonadota bacterium]MBU1610584.1 response regulator [Pseudomonadota bacterium]